MSWKNNIPFCFGEKSKIFAESKNEFHRALVCIQEALELGISIVDLKAEFEEHLRNFDLTDQHITAQTENIETYINIADFYMNV